MFDQLAAAHDVAKAQFEKLAESRSMLDKARAELTSLSKLGDLVTQEDVIKGAGKLVAAGLSPMAVAKLLSDMPEKGTELNAWLTQHATGLAERETQLAPVLEAARHQLGVAAMKTLVGHHIGGAGAAVATADAAPSNPLMPSTAVPARDLQAQTQQGSA